MKIALFCLGSRGDCQPIILLAKALKDRGHQAVVVIEERIKYLAELYGVEYDIVEGDLCSLFFNNDYEKREDPWKLKIEYDNENWQILKQYYISSIGKDLIITNSICIGEAYSIKEKLGIPFIAIHLTPILPSNYNLSPFFPFSDLKVPFLNKLSHKVFVSRSNKIVSKRLATWRKEYLGLGPIDKDIFKRILYDPNILNIAAFDPLMFPNNNVPKDYKDNWKVVGFYLSNQVNINHIPDRLITFLKSSLKYKNRKGEYISKNNDNNDKNINDDGDNINSENEISYKDLPIVFGLGSMPVPEKQKIISILKYTINKLGKDTKWIILNNWMSWDESFESDNVMQLNNIDHIWLYRYCSIAISHGGIGSCAAILKSAIPSIITHLYFDQPQNANKLKQLGVSIPMDFLNLTKEELLKSVIKIKDNYQFYKENCLKVQSKFKFDALDETVHLVESNYDSTIV